MKVLNHIFQVLVFYSIIIAISACSSDEPVTDVPETPETPEEQNPELPDSDFDPNVFVDMFNSSENLTFKVSDFKWYVKDSSGNEDWKKQNSNLPQGVAFPAPDFIIIKDSKIYTQIVLWDHDDFIATCFSNAIRLLVKNGIVNNWPVLISRDYQLDKTSLTISSCKLSVKNIKDGKMWLTMTTAHTATTERRLFVITYDIGGLDAENYQFDSVDAAYAWVISEFRAHFGEETKVGTTVFNISEVEDELRRYHEGNLPL